MLLIKRTRARFTAAAKRCILPLACILAVSLQSIALAMHPGSSVLADEAPTPISGQPDLPAGAKTSTRAGANFQDLQRRLLVNPADANAHCQLGHEYNRLGFHELAREEFSKAFRLDPARDSNVLAQFHEKFASVEPAASFADWVEVRQNHRQDRQVQLMEGLVQRLYGGVDYAESIYLKQLNQGSPLHEINIEISLYESTQGNYERALALANHDLQEHPSDAGWLAAAHALNGLRRFAASQSIAEILYRSNPLMIGAGRELAVASLGLGDSAKALAPSIVNLFLWHSPEEVLYSQELCRRALRNLSRSEIVSNAGAASQLLQQAGLSIEYHKRMAFLYLSAGEKAMAAEELSNSISAGTTDAETFALRARLLGSTADECAEASTLMQKAISYDPFNQAYRSEYARLTSRLSNGEKDLAWRLKSWIRN